jgi:hypothetical protein
LDETPIPHTLPGYTELSQSELQLDTMFPSATTANTLPFDSIPIYTYLGNTIIQPTLPSPDKPSTSNSPSLDQPSFSNLPTSTNPDPHWSRGIGLELSPLKTRSARKRTQAGLKATGNSAPATTKGALRGLKALARGDP